jgi:Flp pilus assembly protein TadG
MVEFAVVVPVLLLLIFGTIDLGRFLYAYNNLAFAVREGARLAAVQKDPTTAASQTAVRDRVRQFAVAFGGNATPTVTVTPDAAQPATRLVTVTVTAYPFAWITPLPSFAGFADVNRNWPSATYRWEGAVGP